MACRVLIIGLDGGTWSVLEDVLLRGRMPHLDSLVKSGCSGALASTTPPKTPAAWSSFQTGKNPGKTGVYDFSGWNRKTHDLEYVSSESLGPTVWDHLGQAGKRIVVINVPMTYPARPVSGVLITGLLTPDLNSRFLYPPELRGPLLEHVPDYHIFNLRNASQTGSSRRVRQFVTRLQTIVESRTRASTFVFGRERPDVAMVHFQATDVLQHGLWGALCPEHPLYDPAVHEYLCSEFYGFLDVRLRRISEAFAECGSGPILTLVVSDHGFQTHRKRVRLGNWLAQEGYLSIRPEHGLSPWLRTRLRRLDTPALRMLFERTSLGRKMDHFRRQPAFAVDYDRSTVFSFGRGSDGYVFFLENDHLARQVTEQRLRDSLADLIDPETQTPVLRQICPREEIYSGPKLSELPDWILKPVDGYSFTGNYEHGARGLFAVVQSGRDFHMGMHRAEGVLIAAGDGVRPGRIQGARLWDVAPTLLASLGLPVPEAMDGVVLQDLFTEPLRVQMSSAETPAVSSGSSDAPTYSQADVRNIEQRLRDLGYIE